MSTVYSILDISALENEKECNISISTTTGGTGEFTYTKDGIEITTQAAIISQSISIRIKAIPNEGYRFVYWIYELNSTTRKLSEKESLSIKVNSDYAITPVFVKDENYLVTFLDVNGYVLSYQEVKANSDVKEITVPKQKGYNTRGWDKSLESVNEDLYVSPVYKATVLSVFRDYIGMFFKGLGITLGLSVISVFLALFLGAVICLMRLSKFKLLSIISQTYVEVVRGIPLLLQLLLVYALVPRIDFGSFFNSEVIAALLALFLNSAAYVSEIFRSGIQAVNKGQTEAGLALGLTNWQTMRKIVIPQAIRNVLPSIGNELIMVIKETSLASTVDMGIGELMSVKKQITAATYINIPPFIVIAILYFIVTFSLSKVVRFVERRLDSRD